ncbi:hypothetical protein COL5a_005589 [Colletotrichum fioriniae]|nr:hypothetical protein COL5a_005589 [Colletotrichum fioriniae]
MFLLMFENKLGSAPPNEKGTKVGRTLDLGTGSGIWAMEFGDEHPEAEELGLWNNENITSGWEGFCMAPFTRALNWTREEVLLLMDQVRHEFNDKSIHAYFNV